ncbi:hypothetical protein MLD38_025836 [Melastoma candidum]|uniref:Uncharacterized protein n=1 Tax=Melastoma candidum TaxID=119954 RepID=A0ACB9NWM5_9MYRT|nr:hypothetical protein MLD38_025836 [Melastoma candidum]
MRKVPGSHHPMRAFADRRWVIPFFASLLVLAMLFTSAFWGPLAASYSGDESTDDVGSTNSSEDPVSLFVDTELEDLIDVGDRVEGEAPRLAYLISGTKGDSQRMIRTLQAVYHPRNQYILHLDLEAPPRERLDLTALVKNDRMFSEVENVRVMAQSNLITYKGPTMIASTLQALAILLRESLEWDWFINLSASDYPLVTQDDLLYALSNVSRSLNFIEHGQISGWKLKHRAKSIVVDPGLYLSKKYDLTWSTQRRSLPSSFKLFTGSAWVMLTRTFLEYCIWGWDNLPRTILMYYVNFISSPEGYFQTVICSSEKFKRTAISHDLHYIAWDNPPKQHPLSLTVKDFEQMVKSNAPFARKFAKDDPVLNKIDKELLGRTGRFVPGAWCAGNSTGGADPCSIRGDGSVFRPGPGAKRLQVLLENLLSEESQSNRCL